MASPVQVGRARDAPNTQFMVLMVCCGRTQEWVDSIAIHESMSHSAPPAPDACPSSVRAAKFASYLSSFWEAAMPHLSSLAPKLFALLNGQISADPHVAAYLSVGDREAGDRSVPQFSLCDAGRRETHGRL